MLSGSLRATPGSPSIRRMGRRRPSIALILAAWTLACLVAAVVLGGTSLMGGKASMLGTVLGTMTIAVIGNGLILLHISPFFTQIVTGAIILVAIWLNTKLFDRGFRFGRARG